MFDHLLVSFRRQNKYLDGVVLGLSFRIWFRDSTCAARRCVWFKIESAGGVTDPDPTTPKPPEQSSCDMTKIFGGLNGDHTLKLTSHGKNNLNKS